MIWILSIFTLCSVSASGLNTNFSTKETVSEISGRGFGMDVVKSTLEKIGANLDVATQEEEGTTFVIDITPKKKA